MTDPSTTDPGSTETPRAAISRLEQGSRRIAGAVVRRARGRGPAPQAGGAGGGGVGGGVRGRDYAALERRLSEIEREIQELRRLSRRLNDVIDVVTELLVPAIDRDEDTLAEALDRLDRPRGQDDTED